MRHHRFKSLLLLTTAAVLTLAGCTPSERAQARVSGFCDPDAAQGLIDHNKPTDAVAMRLTGATIVRQIAPGDPVTEDWRDNRITVETDPTSGRVVRATCG